MTNEIRCPICAGKLVWEQLPLVDTSSRARIELKPGRQIDVQSWRQLQEQRDQQVNEVIEKHGVPSVECSGCQRPLPISYADVPAFHVGVIGSVNASKSTFLASLYQAFATGSHAPITATLPALFKGSDRLDEARKQTFERCERLDRTQNASKDLALLDLDLEGTGHSENAHRVVFVDAAGEDLANAESSVRFSFLSDLDGLIFMIDVTELPRIRRLRNEPERPESPEHVLQNFLRVVEARTGSPDAGLRIPLTVVLAKCDEVEGHATHGVSDFLRSNHANQDNLLSAADVRAESKAVWDFLSENVANDQLLNLLAQFELMSLHFSSATGCAIDETTDRYRHDPRPLNVTSPLIALLALGGLLPDGAVSGV